MGKVSERWCVYAGELRDELRREGKKNGKRMEKGGEGNGKEENIRKSQTRDVDGTGKQKRGHTGVSSCNRA